MVGVPKHRIINFMIYSDRNTIFHSSLYCTNKKKITQSIFLLMDKVVDEIDEENILHIVTDNESSTKAVGEILMQKMKHLFWFVLLIAWILCWRILVTRVI